MSIHAPSDTIRALGGGLLPKCDSRALFQSRFADPQATDKTDPTRKEWFRELIDPNRKASGPARADWLPPNTKQLHARLNSRLMVNLAGGVMENANVLLDRYGLPIIPGSAVKACARRMALQALHDWVAAGTERPAEDDACAPCCESFKTPAEMLAAIARIFGWVEQDWEAGKKDGLFRSDFGWACGENHTEHWCAACKMIGSPRGWKMPDEKPWKNLPAFAGTIAFLPASPNVDPGLELDVVTPHHTDYYQKNDPNAVATDTENPVPVYFPAVKPQREQDYFTFPLIPLRLAADNDLTIANLWLANGLDLFGLGAKTAAGYGWFSVSELAEQHKRSEAKRLAARDAEATARAQKHADEQAVKNAPLLAIEPDPLLLERFATLKPDQLRACINQFQYDDRYWPKSPAEEAEGTYQVSLFIYLTETNRALFEEERAKTKSKVLQALQKLASKYARTLPE